MLNKLQKAKIQAMRDKDSVAKSILSLIHSDAINIAKKEVRDVGDNDITKSAKSLIKKNDQAIELILKNHNIATVIPSSVETLRKENTILNGYLPKQMTRLEIEQAVNRAISVLAPHERTRKNQGKVMGQLKKYGDAINMGIASKYVGSKLV